MLKPIDLQKVMEETSKSDLDWFFEQWVYGGGYPKLTVNQLYESKNRNLKLTFSQTQKSDRLIPQAFILPLEIKIKTLDGEFTEQITLKRRDQIVHI